MPIPQPDAFAAAEEDDLFGYGFKDEPSVAETTLRPLPPQPKPAAARKKRGSRSAMKTWLYVGGGIAGGCLVLIAICCGAIGMLPSAANAPLATTLEQRLQSIAYQPIPAPSSSHSIPGSDVRVAFVQSHGVGPAGGMQLRIYMPPGEHAPNSLPCVLVAPAGSPLLYGNDLDDGDYHKETLPYAEAGMVVIFYSLDGPEVEEDPRKMAASPSGVILSYQKFRAAEAGVVNGRNAIDYVLKNLPQVDPNQIYSAGHSSAGTLSLLLAAHEPRLAGAIAYAPCSNVQLRLAELTKVPGIDQIYPGIKQFLKESSPINCAEQIDTPVFLFHARDDSNVYFSESQTFSRVLAQAGVNLTFETTETGDHYDSMIDEGVPRGIEWIRKQATNNRHARREESSVP